jgi:hypothetical protein
MASNGPRAIGFRQGRNGCNPGANDEVAGAKTGRILAQTLAKTPISSFRQTLRIRHRRAPERSYPQPAIGRLSKRDSTLAQKEHIKNCLLTNRVTARRRRWCWPSHTQARRAANPIA